MISRRIAAFEANVALLLLRNCCLWTFTLKDVMMPRDAAREWSALLKKLRRANPDWSGVRVFEIHPGAWDEFSHGLHVHLVSCDFYSDRLLHSIVKASGVWGRWERKIIFDKAAAYYIGKYLSKKRSTLLYGMRLQSTFGLRDYVRLREIVIDSDRARCWRQLAAEVRDGGDDWRSVGWARKQQAVYALHFRVVDRGLFWNEDLVRFVPFGPVHDSDPDSWIDRELERQRTTPVGGPSNYSQQDLRDQEKIGMQGWLISRQLQREHAQNLALLS